VSLNGVCENRARAQRRGDRSRHRLISDEGTEAYSAPSKEQQVNCSTEESLQKGATHA